MESTSRHDGTLEPDQTLTALYRACLMREPEPGALDYWRSTLADQGLEAVLTQFLRSTEFGYKLGEFVNLYPYDQAQPQRIDTQIDAQDMARLWERVSKTWTRLGSEDAFFSVLTNDRWRGLAQDERIDAFYATGEGDLRRLDAWLARNRQSVDPNGLCVEYGCGVGRFTEWLAPRFRNVLALDVSEPHLALARKRAGAKGLGGQVKYARVASPADLAGLAGADLFYSVIVLQHNPPPIIATILDAAFAGLNRGGLAFFQVPTRGGDGYAFDAQAYLQSGGDGWMEMHAVDQKQIFTWAQRRGVRPLEVSPDHCAGGIGVSTTFLMQKE